MEKISRPLFLLILLFINMAFAANSGSYRLCNKKTDALKNIEILQATCIATKESKDCKDLYAQIDKDSKTKDEADYQKLKCDKKTIEDRQKLSFAGDILMACAASLVVDPVKDLGVMIGETAAKASINWDKARDCDKSSDQKKQLITAYNLDMPKLMRVGFPANEKLEKMTCNQIHVLILNHKQTQTNALSRSLSAKALSPSQKNNLTDDEKEFLKYDQRRLGGVPGQGSSGLAEIVEGLYQQLVTKDKCYSAEQTAKLRCEIAGTVASMAVPGLLALRAARLAKLSGLKVEEVLAKIQNAERATAGVSGRIVNQSQRAEILRLSSGLSNEERVALFEKMFNKKLSKLEADQLVKMHDVGSSEGRGFFELTKADKDLKRQLAEAINPETGKPFFTNEEFNAVMRNGITGIMGKEDLRLQSARTLADAFERQDSAKMAEAFKKGNDYYKSYLDLSPEAFKGAIGASSMPFEQNAGMLITQAATGGLKPDEVLTLANKISKIEGGDHAENLAALSARLGQESERLTELSKKGTQILQNDYRQYMIAESRFKLEQEYAAKKFGDKYGDIDYDKFEAADPAGFARYQKISEQVSAARKAAEKKKWPHKEAGSSY